MINHRITLILNLAVIPLAAISTASFANESVLIDEFGMESTNQWIESSELKTESSLSILPQFEQNTDFQYAPDTITTIINFGKVAWDIIKEGKPVVNIQTDVANALPEGVPNWNSLSEWKNPISNKFSFHWKLLGKNMVKFHYTVVFTPGGKWNGTGDYLTNVMLVPTSVKVLWGYTFSAKADVMRVVNIGTQDHPIAALELRLNLILDSLIAHHERSAIFYMTGDGSFNQISFY